MATRRDFIQKSALGEAGFTCTPALRTGEKASFDEAKQEVLAGGKVFQY